MATKLTHRLGPLRVVGRGKRKICEGVSADCEILDCGHWINVRSDFVGLTTAARRRCRKCKQGEPVNVTDEAAKGADDNGDDGVG